MSRLIDGEKEFDFKDGVDLFVRSRFLLNPSQSSPIELTHENNLETSHTHSGSRACLSMIQIPLKRSSRKRTNGRYYNDDAYETIIINTITQVQKVNRLGQSSSLSKMLDA